MPKLHCAQCGFASFANETLYVNAEDLYFPTHTILDLADAFSRTGGKYLFIDEIHKYRGWSREQKLIYDYHSNLHVFFTGSSILNLLDRTSDLSRRVLTYSMQGLSYREYLSCSTALICPCVH